MARRKNTFEIRPTKIRYQGKTMTLLVYRGRYTREDIKKQVKELSDRGFRKKYEGEIKVTLKFDDDNNRSWRSGKFTKYGDPVDVPVLEKYDEETAGVEEYDYINEFHVLLTAKLAKDRGGKSPNNSCLYDALKEVVYPKDFPWENQDQMKSYLGLGKDDMVPIDRMPMVEKALKNKYKIYVDGDYKYRPKFDADYKIYIELKDEHYELAWWFKRPAYVHGVSKTDKIPMVYEFDDVNGIVLGYTEGKRMKIRKQEFLLSKKNNDKKYVLVKKEEGKSLEETYNEFVRDAEILKKETNGMINLYRTGDNTVTVLKYFYDMLKKLILPIRISPLEAQWLENATCGAIVYSDREYKGPGYRYDFSSHYPAIMSDNKMLFPTWPPNPKTFTKEEFDKLEFYQYGIYRCKITAKTPPKMFKFNKNNYYTHITLNGAKELGMKIEIIEDGYVNALIYPRTTDGLELGETERSLVQGHNLFGPTLKSLYELKMKGIKRANLLLKAFWGKLCRRREFRTAVDLNEEHEIKETDVITNCFIQGNKFIYYAHNKDQIYDTGFARIKPFLLAKGREKIRKACPDEDLLIRSHTDSLLLKKPLKKSQYDQEKFMGALIYEGYYDELTINKKNQVIGTFHPNPKI
jgi:hypothetical protein